MGSLQLKKSLGQHLLVKKPKHILDDFIDFLKTNICDYKGSEVELSDPINKASALLSHKIALHIVEIGPGTGALTKIYLQLLSDMVNGYVMLCDLITKYFFIKNLEIFVYFVELDPGMLKILQQEVAIFLDDKQNTLLKDIIQVQYVNYDATKISLEGLFNKGGALNQKQNRLTQANGGTYNLVYFFGALPYNVSKNIIIHAAQEYNKLVNTAEGDMSNVKNGLPAGFTYIIQKEVAGSFVSKPPHSTLLSNMLRLYVASDTLKVVQKLSPGFFNPPPKVDSAILVGRFQSFKNIISRFQHINNKKLTSVSIKAQHYINDLDIIYILKIFSRYLRKTLGKIASMAFKKQEIGEDCRNFIAKYYKNNRFSELLLHDWIAIARHCVNR